MVKKKHRKFSAEFRAEAVRLVLDEGRPLARIARDIDIWPSTLESWVNKARIARSTPATQSGKELSADERAELLRLREQVRTLEMEREILKKATAFFAKENS